VIEGVPAWAFPAVGVAVLVALIAIGIRAYLARRFIRRNEERINSIAFEILRNILIPNGNGGQIHINYLLLTERGLLVLDLFDVPGAVFGGDQMFQWTAIGRKLRFTFANPQSILYDRMAAVKLLAGEIPVEGRLVFTQRGDFPKGKPKDVLRIDQLNEDFPAIDRTRTNVAAAFQDIWQHIKQDAKPNTLG
jgi:hypothetical protein